jgi:hypothetical protein
MAIIKEDVALTGMLIVDIATRIQRRQISHPRGLSSLIPPLQDNPTAKFS